MDLWSLSPLRMLLPLPRRSSMPLCALCKLEFNCRVSSMGIEVSASYWTRTNISWIPHYSARDVYITLRGAACASARQSLNKLKVQRSHFYQPCCDTRTWDLWMLDWCPMISDYQQYYYSRPVFRYIWLTLVVKVRLMSSSLSLSWASLAYRRCWKFCSALRRCWTSYLSWSTRLREMNKYHTLIQLYYEVDKSSPYN